MNDSLLMNVRETREDLRHEFEHELHRHSTAGCRNVIAQRAVGAFENVKVEIVVDERVVERDDVRMVDGLHEGLLLLPVVLDRLLGALWLLHLGHEALIEEVATFVDPSVRSFAELVADRVLHLSLVTNHYQDHDAVVVAVVVVVVGGRMWLIDDICTQDSSVLRLRSSILECR